MRNFPRSIPGLPLPFLPVRFFPVRAFCDLCFLAWCHRRGSYCMAAATQETLCCLAFAVPGFLFLSCARRACPRGGVRRSTYLRSSGAPAHDRKACLRFYLANRNSKKAFRFRIVRSCVFDFFRIKAKRSRTQSAGPQANRRSQSISPMLFFFSS